MHAAIQHNSRRSGLPEACAGVAGWFLFLVFAGVGLVALPMDLVREWWGRPRSTITKSEYLTRATDMARKAKSVKVGSCCQSGSWFRV